MAQFIIGLPIPINASLWNAVELDWQTNVRLPGGNEVTFAGTRIEGGWGINANYVANPLAYIPLAGFNASYFANHTRDDLIASPLFTSFNDSRMASTNTLNIADYQLRAKMLGDAIPAEGFAAGRNETSGVSGNYNYQNEDGIPNGWPRKDGAWRHSDIKGVSYYFLCHGRWRGLGCGRESTGDLQMEFECLTG